jgi:alcohol dehydrogenase class IV
MAHSLGGYLDLPHGESNALLLDHVIRFNYASASDRYERIASMFGMAGTDERALTKAIALLRKRCGIAEGLGSRGVTRGTIEDLAPHAERDACIFTNPRRASLADIKTIYAEAL